MYCCFLYLCSTVSSYLWGACLQAQPSVQPLSLIKIKLITVMLHRLLAGIAISMSDLSYAGTRNLQISNYTNSAYTNSLTYKFLFVYLQ